MISSTENQTSQNPSTNAWSEVNKKGTQKSNYKPRDSAHAQFKPREPRQGPQDSQGQQVQQGQQGPRGNHPFNPRGFQKYNRNPDQQQNVNGPNAPHHHHHHHRHHNQHRIQQETQADGSQDQQSSTKPNNQQNYMQHRHHNYRPHNRKQWAQRGEKTTFEWLPTTHPDSDELTTGFTIWAISRFGEKVTEYSDYVNSLVKIGNFSTISGFWHYFQYLNTTDELRKVCGKGLRLHLFRHNTFPAWEEFPDGAKVSCIVDCAHANEAWLRLVLAFIGEQLSYSLLNEDSHTMEDVEEVCGVSISIRENDIMLSVWHRSGKDERVQKILKSRVAGVLSGTKARVYHNSTNQSSNE